MDCEPEEFQFLGVTGIYSEASKLIVSWRRLFSQISVSLIVPLSFLFLAQIQISNFLFSQIGRNEVALEHTPPGSPSESRLLHRISSEWSAFILFKAVYLVALLIFSLLSTAAVVYTIASVYTAKYDLLLSYRKVLSVVPRVWRRLAHTFLFAFLFLLAYNLLAIFVFVLAIVLVGDGAAAIVIAIALALAYVVGLVWISVVWHLASVVSVLEDARGVTAMARSRELIRGKMRLAGAIFVMMNLMFIGIELVFRKFVMARTLPTLARLGLAAAMLAVMSVLVLFALVVQTVVYFVCKSYHHESIDKSALADHLEVYLGEYMPLNEKDVQMEHLRV